MLKFIVSEGVKHMKKNTSNFLWGGILILVGLFLAGRALNLFSFNIFFDGWWSLFIIVPCFIGLFGSSGEKTSYLIGLCIGIFLLLSAQDIIEWRMFGPLTLAAILVLVGWKMLLPSKHKNQDNTKYDDVKEKVFQGTDSDQANANQNTGYSQNNSYDQNSNYNQNASYSNYSNDTTQGNAQKTNYSNTYSYTYGGQNNTGNQSDNSGYQNAYQNARHNPNPFACTAVLTGRDLRFDNEVFSGAILSAVLGGIELDLRNAIIRENVVIEAKTILGGIDIWVPNYVRVVVNCTPILGGVDNKTIMPLGADEKTITIYLNATCVLGGIDVK